MKDKQEQIKSQPQMAEEFILDYIAKTAPVRNDNSDVSNTLIMITAEILNGLIQNIDHLYDLEEEHGIKVSHTAVLLTSKAVINQYMQTFVEFHADETESSEDDCDINCGM